jgi:hypothetical protein
LIVNQQAFLPIWNLQPIFAETTTFCPKWMPDQVRHDGGKVKSGVTVAKSSPA